MKRLAIHTCKYKHELINFAKCVSNTHICTIQNTSNGINIAWENSTTGSILEELLLLLQNIAMHENNVYRYSPKLRDLASGIRNTDLHIQEYEQLKAFIKTNKLLNLEGYVAFRMEPYKEKLDTILYTIVKKINLFN